MNNNTINRKNTPLKMPIRGLERIIMKAEKMKIAKLETRMLIPEKMIVRRLQRIEKRKIGRMDAKKRVPIKIEKMTIQSKKLEIQRIRLRVI